MTTAMITKDDFETAQRMGKMFFESGLFADTKSIAQAAVKILAGRELGMGPFESMRDLSIIQGKTTMAASSISARIKMSGVYDFEILKFDATGAELQFTKNGKPLVPVVKFDIQDAKLMGLDQKDNYKKQARTMLFWRAVTMGARMHCPEVFGGAIYTPDEISAAPAHVLPEPVAPAKVAPKGITLEASADGVFVSPSRDEFLAQAAEVFGAAEVEEAVARVEAEPMNTGGTHPAVGRPPTEKQMGFFAKLLKKHHLPAGCEEAIVHCLTGSPRITMASVSKALEALKEDALPDVIIDYIDELEAAAGA